MKRFGWALLLVVGCGNEINQQGTTGTGTGSNSTSTGAGGAEVSHLGSGTVRVTSAPGKSSAEAHFVRDTDKPKTTCTRTTHDSCTFEHCQSAAQGGAGGGTSVTPVEVSAGKIRLVGGTVNFDVEADEDGHYLDYVSKQPLFAGGETLSFEVGGKGDLPPTDGPVQAPGPVSVTSPDFSSNHWEVNRQQDTTVSWSNGVKGDQVEGCIRTESGGALCCTVDASSHQMVFPSPLLLLLPVGENVASWSISTIDQLTFDQGGWTFLFAAERPSLIGSSPISATVTLQ